MADQNHSLGAVELPSRGERIIRQKALLGTGYEGIRLPVVVLLDNIRSMYNVGAFFRAADGVALEKVCLGGITAHPPKSAITKTALGAEDVVAWEHDGDAVRMAERLRDRGFEIAAAKQTGNSGRHSNKSTEP
jgi:tRNA G18 (ribose-2'-O)-methylase SpoU